MFKTRVLKRMVATLLIFSFAVIFCGCGDNTSSDTEIRLIRIHIRANSNSNVDQSVKLCVRDNVNAYLVMALEGITDFDTAISLIEERLDTIEDIANKTLELNGFGYKSRARLNNEFFPTRSYQGVVVESGNYDALIIELGEGKGDNWWCVIYPPLCYTTLNNNGEQVEYKSFFKEFFEKYFKK